MSNAVTHFIFDFDGVVADTETVFAHFDSDLINAVLEKTSTDQRVKFDEARSLAGTPGDDKLAIIGERYGVDTAPYQKDFEHTRTKLRKDLFKQYPVGLGKNLKTFLASLETPYALATNRRSTKLLPDLETMNLQDLFKIVIPCDPPLNKKPAPDILLKAAKEMGASPEICTYIGDNALDMQAARAAGMVPIGFVIEGKTGQNERVETLLDHGAVIVIDDFMELKKKEVINE